MPSSWLQPSVRRNAAHGASERRFPLTLSVVFVQSYNFVDELDLGKTTALGFPNLLGIPASLDDKVVYVEHDDSATSRPIVHEKVVLGRRECKSL